MKAMDWLLSQADEEFPPAPVTHPYAEAGELGRDPAWTAFLAGRNGMFAFNRALHVFGWNPERPFHDLGTRNAGAWREGFGPAAEGLQFFAEDVFGHLFGMRSGEAFSFDPESGKADRLAAGFAGWIEYLVQDLSFATGGGVAKAWSDRNGPLPFDHRLSAIKPFVLGGEYRLDNLRPLPWDQNLSFKSDVCRKILSLPEGTHVEIRP